MIKKWDIGSIIYLESTDNCDFIAPWEGAYIILDYSLEDMKFICVCPYEDGEPIRNWTSWTNIDYFITESEYFSNKREESINNLLG